MCHIFFQTDHFNPIVLWPDSPDPKSPHAWDIIHQQSNKDSAGARRECIRMEEREIKPWVKPFISASSLGGEKGPHGAGQHLLSNIKKRFLHGRIVFIHMLLLLNQRRRKETCVYRGRNKHSPRNFQLCTSNTNVFYWVGITTQKRKKKDNNTN